jgi:hypothetical protein
MLNPYKPFALSLSKGELPVWFDKLTTNGMNVEFKVKMDSRFRGNDGV